MGVGLLSVPLALSKCGYVGVLVLLALGFVANYTGKELCRCTSTVAKMLGRPAKSMVRYEEVAEAAFGKFGRQVVSLMMYTVCSASRPVLVSIPRMLKRAVTGCAGTDRHLFPVLHSRV